MAGGVAVMNQDSVIARIRVAWRVRACAVVLLVLTLGAVEDWFGRTDTGDLFGSDGVQYLDCARAFGRGDLRSALNPLWSQGYPALLAAARPLFPATMNGDWINTRAVNFFICCFSMASFAYLLAGLAGRRRDAVWWLGGAGVFVATQVCLGQVSRVGPDELVSALFFLACGMLLRLVRRPCAAFAVAFGATLGVGFLAKAVFLLLGCVMLAVLFVALWHGHRRVGVWLAAAIVFAAIVLGYGVVLSRAVGYKTLGESGALNYAWHVNRLQKWVHWEGGTETAEQAWPKPWIARFAQWENKPPEFGRPLHASVMVGTRPTVYVFREPHVQATYVPYYDPAYWYTGYRHLIRWRYQAISIAKNLGDLAQALLAQPLLYAVLAMLWMVRRRRWANHLFPLLACALIGIAIYLPVHLEGRYLSGFFAVLVLAVLARAIDATERTRHIVLAMLLMGVAAQVIKEQHLVWSRVAHGWSFRDNAEWALAQAVAASGLPRGSETGVISWTPNLHCDWAYLADLRITSEIADADDERVFWAMTAPEQAEVLSRFRAAGAKAVLSKDAPPSSVVTGWRRLGTSRMWMYRLQP